GENACRQRGHAQSLLNWNLFFLPHTKRQQVESQSLLLSRCNDLHTDSPPPVRDPMVGDGDAVRIAGGIVQNMLGTAEGWLGVDDPVLLEELSEELAKATWLSKILE